MQYYRTPPRFGSRRSRFAFFKHAVSWNRILQFTFFGLLGFIILFFGLLVWFAKDLPTPGKLSNPDLYNSTKIFDKNNLLLYSFYKDYNRIYVNLSDIPQTLKDSTIVAEDEDFYKNQGFSIKGYARAVRDLIIYRKVTGGGSTITQQLVKNVLLGSQQSLSRKIKELILAIEVDKRYSKDEILEMYLNDVPYGGTAIGVEAASNLYFGKHVKDLDLAQSAFIAGLPQAPTYYSPYTGTDKSYIGRTQYVLGRLNTLGYISKQQEEKAMNEVNNFTFNRIEDTSIKAPHFDMYVRQQLVDLFGESMVEKGDLIVKTTLDYDIQKKSEEIVRDEIDSLKGYRVGNGAAVVMNPKTGAILAMVGSKDYFDTENDGNFNVAVDGKRQPGSSTKPIMYAVAFEKGYTPATLIMDTPTQFYTGSQYDKPYNPVNYDGKFRGPIQIRFALGNSVNIPAVKMLARVGIKPFMETAYEMGIENWQPTPENIQNVGLSLVLGGRETTLLQETTAYCVFANRGIKKDAYAIEEVDDANGKVLYKHEDVNGKRVLPEDVTFLISHILLDNNARKDEFGPNSWLVVPGHTVAVKTGTTDEKRDNWTIGYTPSYTVGVWVGNNDRSPMNQAIASGITGASPIWNKIMSSILKNKKDEQFQKPDNVIPVEVDAMTGGLPHKDNPKRTEYFIKNTQPTTISPVYKTIKMSRHQNGKIANQDEINHGDFDEKDFIVFTEDDPVSTDGKNRWQEGIDTWIKTRYSPADHPEYFPPTETSDYSYPVATPTSEATLTPSAPTPTGGFPPPTVTPTPTPILPTVLVTP